MANTAQFFAASPNDIELLYTDPIMVCFDNAGAKTSYLVREKYTWDSKTSTQTTVGVEYSANGSTWSITVPTGTQSLGACTVASVEYNINEQFVNSGVTPLVSAAATYHSVSVVILQGSATISVGGVSFVAPQGYSQTWEADNLLTNSITVTATLATDVVIVNTIK